MTRNKRIGIVLIVVGIVLPLAFLAFTSGYKEGAGFINNLFSLKITIVFSEKTTVGIPYRFILAFGMVLIFLGVRSIDMGRTRSKKDGVSG